MIINNIEFSTDLIDILFELRNQLESNGINLLKDIKQTGDDIMVSCPYHKSGQERKPSAGISVKNGTFHCFACGEIHSLPEMISHCFGWNDVGGVLGLHWLLKNFISIEAGEKRNVNFDCKRDSNFADNDRFDSYVSEKELESYRYYHPYMYKRKLTDEIIDLFDVGYDKETDCITFPQRDVNGNTLFIARRSVTGKYFNYPSKAIKPIYGLYELSVQQEYPKEVIICESMLDALTCWVYDKYAVALNGLGTNKQFEELNKMPCRKFILATDNDKAGLESRKKIRKNLVGKIVTEYILPKGKKDINELTKEEFDNLLEVFV